MDCVAQAVVFALVLSVVLGTVTTLIQKAAEKRKG
jgi:hypothetical protein